MIYQSISTLINDLPIPDKVKTNKKISYYNFPVSFDIETSSFEDYNGDKTAIMYVWAMDFNGNTILGRTWGDWLETLRAISEYLETDIMNRLIIYVHNLSYEFQFIRKLFKWYKVFAVDNRKPVYAVTDTGIEFRCNYLLSGYSLEKLATQLKEHEIKKLVGNLDYKLLRHSKTVLSDEEIAYCVNDVQVVTAYIAERIKLDGDITKLPLTKTGYIRRFCKAATFGMGKHKDKTYRNFIKSLTLRPDEYTQLKRGFQGGFTHANPFYSGKVVHNVASYDFTSSYPAVMVSEKFPMEKSEEISNLNSQTFYDSLKIYCCLFDVRIEGLNSRIFTDSYISLSRCWGVVNGVINNGRIVKADLLYTTLTEQDFMIINTMYEWDSLSVAHFRRYKRNYLPSKFVESILSLYNDKTKLKGIEERSYDYARSKEMLNSAYGMIVTDICRDDNIYVNDEWMIETNDLEKQISKYNSSMGRFLFYPWGVWVTAYARRNLFTGIFSVKEDYIYSDTDSMKILNQESHVDYINRYNDMIMNKVIVALNYHGIDIEMATPKTIKGISKPIGVWDYEGNYERFKTLGAKRYLVENGGDLTLTVSGLNKKDAINYLQSNYDDVFSAFNDEMYIPKGHTGKMIHTYIDEERKGTIQDYNGIFSEYSEKSSVHLDDADYSLKLGHEYADFLMGLEHMEG